MDAINRYRFQVAKQGFITGFIAGSGAVTVSSLIQSRGLNSSVLKAAGGSGMFMGMIFAIGSVVRI
jgi:hypothetical protein